MSSEAIDIRSILDDIVHQFADPLAFFRELVQNSIDAGTGEIEIDLQYDASKKMLEVHVADWGEGMNREIVETKLTRLFSSGKDDDLTKIGRFGIGFVSVFAIAPQTVVVDTGRDGQFWRVIFAEDRTYELYALDRPVEGTLVRIFKPMESGEFSKFKDDARRVIVTWCKHASVPIVFLGEDIREDFDIDSAAKITHEEQGTRIVMGYVKEFAGPVGYYNRGLTLREHSRGSWPYVSYKIDSRYLEHTLTRDQIIEDGHFEKAYGILRRMATVSLPEHLIDELEKKAHEAGSTAAYKQHCLYLANYLRSDHRLRRPWRRRRILKRADGEVTSLHEVNRAIRRGKAFFVSEPGPLCEAAPSDAIILIGRQTDEVGALLEAALENRPTQLEERYFLMSSCGDRFNAAAAAVSDLLAKIDHPVGAVRFADLALASSTVGSWMGFLVDGKLDLVDLRTEAHRPSLRHLDKSRALVIDEGEDVIRGLLGRFEQEPEWVAMTLVKLLIGHEAGSLGVQDALVTAAVMERKRRLEEV
ncbi:MAG: sacsin N-terminal ATP-binding-like domain-containing protein [Bradymonadaceae bacterium]